MSAQADIVICGAGIAGISAAFFLSEAGFRNILLVDTELPLALTSNHSTECYRNWWPDPFMAALTNRSIDLMERLAFETSNAFHLNRRGYLYITADSQKIPELIETSTRIAAYCKGELRIHKDGSRYQANAAEGFSPRLNGADLLIGQALITRFFPGVSRHTVAALHVRRAGWLSAQTLGMTMLDQAKQNGVRFESAKIVKIDTSENVVRSVMLADGRTIQTTCFINAAGPFFKDVGLMLGLDLPVFSELHLKAAINDPLGCLNRESPLMIWTDPQQISWTNDEFENLARDPETQWLTEIFPGGAHTRPEGSGESQSILMLWEYQTKGSTPVFPIPVDPLYPEIALRGLSSMLPALQQYFPKLPRPQVDGGYYTKTRENRPLIGPTPIKGAFLCGALSGFGIMAACAAGELLAAHMTNSPLPDYAAAFELTRYDTPAYLDGLACLQDQGQL